MKKCMSCGILVGGSFNECPICQNHLEGEDGKNCFAPPATLKKNSLFLRIQFFVVALLAVMSLMLDFIFKVHGALHWSLIVLAWVIGFEVRAFQFTGRRNHPSRIISEVLFTSTILMVFTSWYIGFFPLYIEWLMPCTTSALLIASFVFALIDKKGNALIFLLFDLGIGLVPYIIMLFFWGIGEMPIPWNICLMIQVISLLGICVFKGNVLKVELHKRMNF